MGPPSTRKLDRYIDFIWYWMITYWCTILLPTKLIYGTGRWATANAKYWDNLLMHSSLACSSPPALDTRNVTCVSFRRTRNLIHHQIVRHSAWRLELVHVNVWRKHFIILYIDLQYLIMFTDYMSRIRLIIVMQYEHIVAEALEQFVTGNSSGERAHKPCYV